MLKEMLKNLLKKRPHGGLEYAACGFTALAVGGVVRILGLAGTVDYQNTLGQPGMSVPALLGHIALAVVLTAAGVYGRKRCLRASAEKRCALPRTAGETQPRTSALNASMSASISRT